MRARYCKRAWRHKRTRYATLLTSDEAYEWIYIKIHLSSTHSYLPYVASVQYHFIVLQMNEGVGTPKLHRIFQAWGALGALTEYFTGFFEEIANNQIFYYTWKNTDSSMVYWPTSDFKSYLGHKYRDANTVVYQCLKTVCRTFTTKSSHSPPRPNCLRRPLKCAPFGGN